MSSDHLVRCLRCQRTFVRAEYDEHVCVPHYKGVRDIPIIQWWESKTEYGEPLIMAIGADGYTYRLVQLKSGLGFVEANLNSISPDFEHPDKYPEDDNRTQGV